MIGGPAYLALRSLWWYRGRALTIVACLGLTLWLPLTVRLLLNQFRTELVLRARQTPLVIGAPGSRIDLALSALYFDSPVPRQTKMAEAHYVQDTGFATAIPLHVVYKTQSVGGTPGVPIVGAAIEYFEFRGLGVARGSGLQMLGDCVLGCNAARRLGLGPGDQILSAPKNAFNLAGDYPLKMNIKGVLAASHSPDDDVVFVDLKTTWVIDGIGHGHQNVEDQHTDKNILLDRTETSVTASAAVLPYTEITPENLHTFHFHGREETWPVSAVIAVPHSEKDQTLLLGRYKSDRNEQAQCVRPLDVVQDLLSVVFRVERLVWLSSLLSATATALLLGLVIFLTIRLRAAEMQTMHKIGCSRLTVVKMTLTEIGLMIAAGTLLAGGAAWLTRLAVADHLRRLMF